MNDLIYHTNKFLTLPGSVEDLTGKQLSFIAELLHSGSTRLAASLKALRVLSGTSLFKFSLIKADVKLRCLEHVQWIFEGISVTKQLLLCYNGFYGVKDEFDNMVLSEFHFAEKFYCQIKGQDYSNLDSLIAVIYRKPKSGYNLSLDKDGDARQEFNSNEVDYYAEEIRTWPRAVKLGILMFYDSCRKKIAAANDEIFSGGDEEDSGLGMYGVMRGIAGPKFGDLEKVEKMYLHTALLELNLMMKEEKRMEAQYKTA